MAMVTTFTTLDEDILNIIINLLQSTSPKSLRSLSLASRYCKALGDPSRYRSVELNNDGPQRAFTERTVSRLLDPNDDLSGHVRHLTVVDHKGIGGYFGASALENIISGLFHLQFFSWDGDADIPERILSRLEDQWPSAKLIMREHDREIIDTRALSSPNLYDLAFVIFNSRHKSNPNQQSLLPDLRRFLINSSGLRRLDLTTRRGQYQGNGDHTLNLPLVDSDSLPPLHDLKISGPAIYDFEFEHCRLWSRCMDWTQLQTLDLGFGCPQHFFEEIGSRLVSLKSLKMEIRTGDYRDLSWGLHSTCETIEPVVRFIESLTDLYELHIKDPIAAVEDIVPVILGSQKSLRTLSYYDPRFRLRARSSSRCTWKIAQLHELRQQALHLSHLEIDLPLHNGKWPTDYAATLARFNHLHSLKLNIGLDDRYNDFATSDGPCTGRDHVPFPSSEFKTYEARDIITGLFKDFFNNHSYDWLTEVDCKDFFRDDAKAWLTDLEVYFTRDFGRKFPMKVRRLERDDAPSPADGGYEVDYPDAWLNNWT